MNATSLGHHFSIDYSNRKGIKKHITAVVINFEQQYLRKEEKKGFTLADKAAFMDKWKKDNYDLMISVLGVNGTSLCFVSGIVFFFAPSLAQATVPLLQNVVQADTCHVNFGKYTTYVTYGSAAQSKMFPSDLLSFLEMKTRKVGLSSGGLSWIYILI